MRRCPCFGFFFDAGVADFAFARAVVRVFRDFGLPERGEYHLAVVPSEKGVGIRTCGGWFGTWGSGDGPIGAGTYKPVILELVSPGHRLDDFCNLCGGVVCVSENAAEQTERD